MEQHKSENHESLAIAGTRYAPASTSLVGRVWRRGRGRPSLAGRIRSLTMMDTLHAFTSKADSSIRLREPDDPRRWQRASSVRHLRWGGRTQVRGGDVRARRSRVAHALPAPACVRERARGARRTREEVRGGAEARFHIERGTGRPRVGREARVCGRAPGVCDCLRETVCGGKGRADAHLRIILVHDGRRRVGERGASCDGAIDIEICMV